MVNTCCVAGCAERIVKGGPYTFHSFPKEDGLRRIWENSIGRDYFVSTKNTRICSKHFEHQCFLVNEETGYTWLRPNVVPTLFIVKKNQTDQGGSKKQKNKYEKCLARLSSRLAESVERSKPAEFSPRVSSRLAEKVERNKSAECSANTIPTIVSESQDRMYSCLDDFTEEDMNSPEIAQKVLLLATMLKEENQNLKRKYRSLGKKDATFEGVLRKKKNPSLISENVGCVLEGTETLVKEEQDQSQKDNIPLEPAVRIKEESSDDYPTPSTSKDTANGEFMLPHIDDFWTIPISVATPQLTSLDDSLSTKEPVSSDGGPLKKKQRTNSSGIKTNASTSNVVSNHTATGPQSPAIEGVSTPGSSKEHRTNQFDSFINYVGNKLSSLDPISSECAQKAIQNIILEAEMGKYLNQTEDIKPLIVPDSI